MGIAVVGTSAAILLQMGSINSSFAGELSPAAKQELEELCAGVKNLSNYLDSAPGFKEYDNEFCLENGKQYTGPLELSSAIFNHIPYKAWMAETTTADQQQELRDYRDAALGFLLGAQLGDYDAK